MELRRADPRFVLPGLPHRVALDPDVEAWAPGFQRDGGDVVASPGQAEVAIRSWPSRAGGPDAPVTGYEVPALRGGPAAGAGTSVRRWWLLGRRPQPVAVVPAGDRVLLAHALAQWRPGGTLAAWVRRGLHVLPAGGAALPRVDVVAPLGADVPAFLRTAIALGAPADVRGYLLTVGGSQGRRIAAPLWPRGVDAPAWVLKIPRDPDVPDMSRHEQTMLETVRALRLPGVVVPAVVGRGGLDGHDCSLETAMRGRPLRDAYLDSPRVADAAVGVVVTWLRHLAAATRSTAPPDADALLHRSDAYGELGPVVREAVALAAATPGVLGHGDLVDGGNVLADGEGVAVIDWESAQQGSYGLDDLLPFLVRALAVTAAGTDDTDVVTAAALALVEGRSPRSAEMFALVRAHLDALGVPSTLAGPLAACAWTRHGRAQDELVARLAAAGLAAPADISWAAVFAQEWLARPHLAARWAAFSAALR